jgi:hypothetical protein
MYVVVLGSCGPKSGGGGPRGGDVAPALQFVPADVSYVAAIRRVDGAIAATHDLIEAVGILGNFDPSQIEDEFRNYLGVVPISVDDLRSAGVDVAAGAAVFSQGFSPTFVFTLADPAAMQARIETQRERASATAVGVAVRDGVDIYTDLGDRDIHTHWAIDGTWMWVHFEIVAEHEQELAWFEASRGAKGAITADADFAWAVAEADRVQSGAPLVGLVRPHRMAARLARAVNEPEATACLGLVTPPRAAVAMGAAGGVSEGHVLVDTAGGGRTIEALAVPVPSGWAAARGQPAIGFEWNLDLLQLARRFKTCDDDPAQALAQLGVRAGRGFIQSFDPETLEGRGAVAGELTSRTLVDQMLDAIPGRAMFETKKKFGSLDGVRLSVPMIPTVDYILTAERGLAATGDGLLAQLVGDGKTTPGVLAGFEIRPSALSPEAWNALLELASISGRQGREATIRRINRWKHATIALTRDGDLLHLHARGERP